MAVNFITLMTVIKTVIWDIIIFHCSYCQRLDFVLWFVIELLLKYVFSFSFG